MKIFIVCSKFNYKYIKEIKKALKLMNYDVILPNYYETPYIEEEIKGDNNRNIIFLHIFYMFIQIFKTFL